MIDGAETATIAELRPCGLTFKDVVIHYDDELQSTVITVSRLAKIETSRFPCIRQAVWGKADVSFEDAKVDRLYRAFDDEVGRAEGRAAARAWFAQRGMLDRMHSFAPGDSASSAIAKIEAFCGIKPGVAFEQRYPGVVSVKRDFMAVPMQPTAECLFHAMAAIDIEQLGFKVGFIGNEALSEEKK